MIEHQTLHILNSEGRTVGTGFLVTNNLVVTSAHVIVDADAYSGDVVQVQFTGRDEKVNALVIPDHWLDIDQGDVAILKLESIPEGIAPLRLDSAADCRSGNPFYAFGYATAADVQGIIARGTIDGYLPQHKLLQLQAPQASHGISGAPVLDQKRGVVVGMITKGHTELGRNEETTFATPSEVIWLACPQLKPPTPVLPKRSPLVEGITLLPYDYASRIQNFITEYLGTAEQPEPFGGRNDALKELNDWLIGTTTRMLLVAPAGRGKSALLLHWLDTLLSREDIALVFVPVSVRFRTNLDNTFFAALAARLAFLHGEDVPTSMDISTDVWRGLVSNFLSKPLVNGKTLLVVVDGLDEAGDWEAGTDLVPAELPQGVRVVVSARFLAGDRNPKNWLAKLGWERKDSAVTMDLLPLTPSGVEDVLIRMGFPLKNFDSQANIVRKLYELSQGDPLLVHLYAETLSSYGENVARIQPQELENIQPGYEGYFDRWWKEQKKLWQLQGRNPIVQEQLTALFLNICSLALGPITIDEFIEISGDPSLTGLKFREIVSDLGRLLVRDGDNYTLSHSLLHTYFIEQMGKSEEKMLRSRLIRFCEEVLNDLKVGKITPAEAYPYAVQHLGAHLQQINADLSRLDALICPEWLTAWETLFGSYAGFLRDLDRAWAKVRSPNYFAHQIRYAFVLSTIQTWSQGLPEELWGKLLKYGDVIINPQAILEVIGNFPISYQKADAIHELAPFIPISILPRALEISLNILKDNERGLLGLVPYLSPELIVRTFEYLHGFEQEYKTAWVIEKLAPILPEYLVDSALELAYKIKDANYRAVALGNMIVRTGDVVRERVINNIKISLYNSDDLGRRAQGLTYIAEYIPFDEFMEILKLPAEKETEKYLTDGYLAESFFRKGKVDLGFKHLKHFNKASLSQFTMDQVIRCIECVPTSHFSDLLDYLKPEGISSIFKALLFDAAAKKFHSEDEIVKLANLAKSFVEEDYLVVALALISTHVDNKDLRQNIQEEIKDLLISFIKKGSIIAFFNKEPSWTYPGKAHYRIVDRLPGSILEQLVEAYSIDAYHGWPGFILAILHRLPDSQRLEFSEILIDFAEQGYLKYFDILELVEFLEGPQQNEFLRRVLQEMRIIDDDNRGISGNLVALKSIISKHWESKKEFRTYWRQTLDVRILLNSLNNSETRVNILNLCKKALLEIPRDELVYLSWELPAFIGYLDAGQQKKLLTEYAHNISSNHITDFLIFIIQYVSRHGGFFMEDLWLVIKNSITELKDVFEKLSVIACVIDVFSSEQIKELMNSFIPESTAEEHLEQSDYLYMDFDERRKLSILALEILITEYFPTPDKAKSFNLLSEKINVQYKAIDSEDDLRKLHSFTCLAPIYSLVVGSDIYREILKSFRKHIDSSTHYQDLIPFTEFLRFFPIEQASQALGEVLMKISKPVQGQEDEIAIEQSEKLSLLWSELPDKKCYILLEEHLPLLAKRDRVSFSLIIYSLTPVFMKLWGDQSITIILDEMNKVRSWWP